MVRPSPIGLDTKYKQMIAHEHTIPRLNLLDVLVPCCCCCCCAYSCSHQTAPKQNPQSNSLKIAAIKGTTLWDDLIWKARKSMNFSTQYQQYKFILAGPCSSQITNEFEAYFSLVSLKKPFHTGPSSWNLISVFTYLDWVKHPKVRLKFTTVTWKNPTAPQGLRLFCECGFRAVGFGSHQSDVWWFRPLGKTKGGVLGGDKREKNMVDLMTYINHIYVYMYM